MSQENVEIVRQPITVGVSSRRSPEYHLVRFPGAFAILSRALWGLYVWLPPRSRFRRAIARRYIQSTFAALNRGDLVAAIAVLHKDSESILPPGLVAIGLEPVYRGRKARLEMQERWNAEWGEWRMEPQEVFDLGDGARMLLLGRMKGSGLSSGVPVDAECAFLVTFSKGQVIREQIFLDHREALEAVGLSE